LFSDIYNLGSLADIEKRIAHPAYTMKFGIYWDSAWRCNMPQCPLISSDLEGGDLFERAASFEGLLQVGRGSAPSSKTRI
jgi:hypothetical protein